MRSKNLINHKRKGIFNVVNTFNGTPYKNSSSSTSSGRVFPINKKGSVELQFNWLFVFIIGSMILLFFFSITNKQKEVSDSKIAASVITDLEAITTGARVAKGTAQIIDTPDLELEFDCTDCSCSYSIGRNSKDFREKIVFAPKLIKGNKIVSWTLSWNIPFRVENFLYLTSPDIRYIFFYSSDNLRAKEIIDDIPNEIAPYDREKEVYDSFSFSNIKDQNNYKVRVILFDPNPTVQGTKDNLISIFEDMKSEDLTLLEVNTLNGELKFFEKDGSGFISKGVSYSLKNPTIYGAVFSDSIDTYECNLKAGFERLFHVSDIYINRSLQLNNHYPSGPCRASGNYRTDSGFNKLEEIRLVAGDLQYDLDPGKIGDLLNYISSLSQKNYDLMLKSCREIY